MGFKQAHSGRRLRCIIIGAGYGPPSNLKEMLYSNRDQCLGHLDGIEAQKLRESFGDEVDFQVFEKNSDVGGTWFENRYPGCACDVPSHIYQFSFCPNPYWSSFYASSAEIQAYLKAVVVHYELGRYIHFNSKVGEAVWDDILSLWTVDVEGKGRHECEILVNAGGILNNLQWPNFGNRDSFKGTWMHTAAWDPEIDIRGKRVAIVGAGASAIQVLPAIQTHVLHTDIYIRTPSWITPPAGKSIDGERNHTYTSGEKTKFRDDPNYSLRTRKFMESTFNSMYNAFFKGSIEQHQMEMKLERHMKELINDVGLQKRLIPSFEVGCRRINPGEQYLEAIQTESVEPIFDAIERVTADGILAGGKERPVDIIIAATGFDTSFRPRFPIIGSNGTDLRELWKDDPVSYCGLAVSGFPNYLMFLGPNTPISNGSLMGSLEATGDFFVRLITKMIKQRASSFNVRQDVQSDFDRHTQQFMQGMVWTGGCRSWFKSPTSGKVTAIWPGSSLHYREVLASDRWEDFEWEYKSNRFAYWGRGFSEVEGGKDPDLSYYIKEHPNLPLEAYCMAGMGVRSKLDRPNSGEAVCESRPDSEISMKLQDGAYTIVDTGQNMGLGSEEALSMVAAFSV